MPRLSLTIKNKEKTLNLITSKILPKTTLNKYNINLVNLKNSFNSNKISNNFQTIKTTSFNEDYRLLSNKKCNNVKINSTKYINNNEKNISTNLISKNSNDNNLPAILQNYHLADEKEDLNINYKKVSKFFEKKREDLSNSNNCSIMLLVEYTNQLEKLHLDISSEIKKMKNYQINRIGKEYLTNDYERIYGVNINVVFSVIVGENNIDNELIKYFKAKNNYYKSLELCRNYNSYLDIYNNKNSNI